eukprot:s2007_g3.t1
MPAAKFRVCQDNAAKFQHNKELTQRRKRRLEEAGIGTEILYEADSQATPLRALDAVLSKIRSGAFRPDAARGDQFQEGDAQAAQSGDPEDECGVGDMASSSEDSADEEQPGRELDEIAEAEALGQWHGRVDLAKLGESPQFYRHSMSRVLHLLEEGGTTFRSAVQGQAVCYMCSTTKLEAPFFGV